jgi:hypothetical protein
MQPLQTKPSHAPGHGMKDLPSAVLFLKPHFLIAAL